MTTNEIPIIDHQRPVNDRYVYHEIEVEDPYLSDQFERVNAELKELSDMGYYGDPSIDLTRKRKGTIDRDNPSTAELIRRLPTFSDWLDLIPTAAALDSLYDPHKETLANGKPMSRELAEWFCNIVDGRGIRSRAEIVRQVMMEDTLALDRQARWLSLASGAAQPVIKTASMIGERGGVVPSVTLVDRDRGSLALARHYAEEAGIDGSVQTKSLNILQRGGIDRPIQDSDFGAGVSLTGLTKQLMQGNRLPEGFYDTVEVVGLTEYLRSEDWTYTYHKVISTSRPMAGAETFLRNSFKLVRPGGSLIVGNMLDTHPQLGFTLNVIQWPHIQPRSIDQMMDVFDSAGLDAERDVYTAADGAYAIYKISKAA